MFIGDAIVVFTPEDKKMLLREKFQLQTDGRKILTAFAYKIGKGIKPHLLRGCVYVYQGTNDTYLVYGRDNGGTQEIKYTPTKALFNGQVPQDVMDALSDIYVHNMKDFLAFMSL
jgi:hypothetical protein